MHPADEQHWQQEPGLEGSESPEYLGRAVAALAANPDVLRRSGQVRVLSKVLGGTWQQGALQLIARNRAA